MMTAPHCSIIHAYSSPEIAVEWIIPTALSDNATHGCPTWHQVFAQGIGTVLLGMGVWIADPTAAAVQAAIAPDSPSPAIGEPQLHSPSLDKTRRFGYRDGVPKPRRGAGSR